MGLMLCYLPTFCRLCGCGLKKIEGKEKKIEVFVWAGKGQALPANFG
jgi:hypothetical protein